MADLGSVTFKDLHLFPLFAIGAALFISSLVPPLVPPPRFPVALLGLGLIFFAVGFDILYDIVRSWKPGEEWNKRVQRIVLWAESVIAIVIALLAFGWAAVLLRCTPAHLGID